MKMPSKKDFSKYSVVVFMAGAALGAGLTSFISASRGVRKIEKEDNE